MKRFNVWYCCCCRPKRKRNDFLFKNAKSKLSEEIDLLEIVKKLRVHQFASHVTLRPHQRDLVNFFQEYKLSGPKEDSTLNEVKFGQKQGRPDSYASGVSDSQKSNRPLADVEQSLDLVNLAAANETDAVNHLYKSITELEPANDIIDAKILQRVTKTQSSGNTRKRQMSHLSAQDVL